MELFLLLFIVALAGLVYFLPTLIAHSRGHKQTTAIFVLNLFLGWSFFAWIACLVWAFIRD